MLIEDPSLMHGCNTVNFFILVKNDAVKFIEFVESVLGGIENKYARTPDKDGSLIHAEVRVGTSTLLIADSKPDWPFTPAFPQVYVTDAQEILDRATKAGAEIVTEVSHFYNGLKLARFSDPWGNLWWLFEKSAVPRPVEAPKAADTSWHDQKPSAIYTTLMEAMRNLKLKV